MANFSLSGLGRRCREGRVRAVAALPDEVAPADAVPASGLQRRPRRAPRVEAPEPVLFAQPGCGGGPDGGLAEGDQPQGTA
eukprot:6834377-Alexandrium_andersonii.AAC.1